jgi:hypothetical protein
MSRTKFSFVRTRLNPVNSGTYVTLSRRVVRGFVTNLFTWLEEISLTIDMRLRREFQKALAVAFLVLTLALVVGGIFANVNATQSPPYPFPPTFPVNNFDFTITTSKTLVKIQQGETGHLVVWVNLYCPNSTTTIKCDSTVLQTVALSISGCPGGAVCVLDRQQVQLRPRYQAASNLIIYTFTTITTSSSPAQMTVTGIDQFGDTHSATFGAIVCYC